MQAPPIGEGRSIRDSGNFKVDVPDAFPCCLADNGSLGVIHGIAIKFFTEFNQVFWAVVGTWNST
jgi:hypothetical protein